MKTVQTSLIWFGNVDSVMPCNQIHILVDQDAGQSS